jgi:Helix-hairpin-helix motif
MLRTRCAGCVAVAVSMGLGLAGASVAALGPPPAVPPQQPGLTLDCAPGQVDLNHASLAELQTLPGVSGPIAQRIVASRPHDRVRDLLVVPGVGPDTEAAIAASGKACATPLTLPPPAADVCTNAQQIDVNTPASRPRLASLFGRPTADRVVAAQPFPDLAHALTVLVAGAGAGKVSKYRPLLCATPVPKTTHGENYSWVYSAAGGRADDGKFSLIVPPGVLANPVGQWLHIKPLETPTPDVLGQPWPSAIFEILGTPWEGGGKKVYVTVPIDPALAAFGDGWEPDVAHWSDTDRSGGTEAAGEDIYVDQAHGTVTTPTTSLSPLDGLARALQWVFEPFANVLADARFPAPSCDGSWGLDPASGNWSDRAGGRVELGSAYLNLPGNPVPPLGWPIKHCVESGGADRATLRLRNNSRTFMSLVSYGGTTPELGNVGVGGDLLSLSIAEGAQALLGHPVAYPGGEVTATVPAASFNAVRMVPNIPLTVIWTTLQQSQFEDLVKLLPGYPPITGAVKHVVDCVLSSYGASGLNSSSTPQQIADSALGYIRSCFTPTEFWQLLEDGVRSGAISGELANRVSSTLDKLSRYSLWIRVGRITVSGVDALLNATGGSAGIIGITYRSPKPTLDSLGRPVFADCVSANGYGWKIDIACQNAHYAAPSAGPDGSIGAGWPPFPSVWRVGNYGGPRSETLYYIGSLFGVAQGTFDASTEVCLSRRYPLRDYSLPGALLPWVSESGTPATCNSSLPEIWLPANATNWILREASGTAFLVNGSGKLEWIQDGGTYIACAQHYLVLDYVPPSMVAQFGDPVNTILDGPYASCS